MLVFLILNSFTLFFNSHSSSRDLFYNYTFTSVHFVGQKSMVSPIYNHKTCRVYYFKMFNYIIYLFCVYVGTCYSALWRPEDDWWDSVLSFHHINPSNQHIKLDLILSLFGITCQDGFV